MAELMGVLRFKATGAATETLRKSLRQPGRTLAAKAMMTAVVVITVVYTINQPGKIRFSTPVHESYTDAKTLSVSGTVANATVDEIGLRLLNHVYQARIKESKFAVEVKLAAGRNEIFPLSNNAGVHLVNHSQSLVIHSVENPGPVRIELPPSNQPVFTETVQISGTVGLSAHVSNHALRTIGITGGKEQVVADVVDGQFEVTVQLKLGENILRGCIADTAVRLAHNFPEHKIIRSSGDQTGVLPQLPRTGSAKITAPKNGAYVLGHKTDLSITINNPTFQRVTLLVNGQPVKDLTQPRRKSSFPSSMNLVLEDVPLVADSINTIEVVIGADGQSVSSPPFFVMTPALIHDFEDDRTSDRNWTLRGKATSVTPDRIRGENGYQLLSRESEPRVEIVFLIDTSDSMQEEIEAVQKRVEAILDSLNRRFPTKTSLVTFAKGVRFYDALTSDEVKQRTDLDSLVATGGLNPGEDLYLGILQALDTKIEWSTGTQTTKAIVMMTDEGASEDTLRDLIEDQTTSIAREKTGRLGSYQGDDLEALTAAADKLNTTEPELAEINLRAIVIDKAREKHVSIHSLIFPVEAQHSDRATAPGKLRRATEVGAILAAETGGYYELFLLNPIPTQVLASVDQTIQRVAIAAAKGSWNTDAITDDDINVFLKHQEPLDVPTEESSARTRAQTIETVVEEAATSKNPRMWVAPSDVVNLLRDEENPSYGATIVFELQQETPDKSQLLSEADDFVLVCPNARLVRTFSKAELPPQGKQMRIRLEESTLWKLFGSNAPVSASTFRETLSTLTEVWIRADYQIDVDTSTLDNFAIFRTASSSVEPERQPTSEDPDQEHNLEQR